jgi:hypothetical protein
LWIKAGLEWGVFYSKESVMIEQAKCSNAKNGFKEHLICKNVHQQLLNKPQYTKGPLFYVRKTDI